MRKMVLITLSIMIVLVTMYRLFLWDKLENKEINNVTISTTKQVLDTCPDHFKEYGMLRQLACESFQLDDFGTILEIQLAISRQRALDNLVRNMDTIRLQNYVIKHNGNNVTSMGWE